MITSALILPEMLTSLVLTEHSLKEKLYENVFLNELLKNKSKIRRHFLENISGKLCSGSWQPCPTTSQTPNHFFYILKNILENKL